jgi:hypothetical protein
MFRPKKSGQNLWNFQLQLILILGSKQGNPNPGVHKVQFSVTLANGLTLTEVLDFTELITKQLRFGTASAVLT